MVRGSRSEFLRIVLVTGVTLSAVRGQTDPTSLLADADRLADQGNWSRAREIYATAEAEFTRAGDHRHALYARFGRLHGDAEAGSYETVRQVVVQDLADNVVQADPELKIRGLALLGTIDLNLDTAAALEDWTNVLTVAKSAGDRKWQNRANGQLGLVAGLNGDIGSAGIALYQAITQAAELGDVAGQVHFATWLANGLATNGMADRAVELLDRITELTRKHGYDQVPLQLSIAKVRAMLLLPDAQRQISLPDAKSLLAKTLAEAESHGVSGAQTELLIQAGEVALSDRDYQTAEASFLKAADVAHKADLPRMESEALLQLSRVYRAGNQPRKAADAIDAGIGIGRTVEEPYRLPVLVAEKAEVEAALGSVDKAVALYGQATDLIEGLLVNAQSSRVKTAMIGALSDIYVGHFRLAWHRQHNAPEAFRIIESARGRSLLDSIRYARQSGATFQQVPAEREIARLQKALVQQPLSASERGKVLERLDAAYFRLSPVEYVRSRREMEMLRRPPVSLSSIQRQLSAGETLVEFVLDARQSYALQVTQEGLTVHTLADRAVIDQAVRQFLSAVKGEAPSDAAAQHLYRMLLYDAITKETSALIVVPDGSLHLLPFAALVNGDGKSLNRQLAVVSAPSASTYFALRTAHRTSATRPFLGVAYTKARPAPTQTASAAVRGVLDLRGADLKPIEFGSEEVRAAAAALGQGSVALDGDKASESILKSQPLRAFKVIHVAAHGISNESEPDRAALILFPGGGNEDGLWQAREIRQSRLNADLVVLSACDTGTGRLAGQEGIMNLARAFLTAGAKSVIASLWSVNDRTTATLMESFYEHLSAGLPVREALRRAQLDFVKTYGDKAHPYYWAGFEVIGDGTRRIAPQTRKTDLRSTGSNFR
jgi:CHAT domain-containing protein